MRAWIVPQSVVTYSPYGNSVFVVEQGEGGTTVRKAFINTGATRGDQVVVSGGIKAGDEVVTAGQQKLRNGSAVAVNNSVPVSNQAAPVPANN